MTLVVHLAACNTQAVVPATPIVSGASARFCGLKVVGNQIQTELGDGVVLHGANLPTLSEIEASAYPIHQRLQDLADGGAKIVRVLVEPTELLPDFVPGKLLPVLERVNALGLVAIVGMRNNPEATLNKQVDAAEHFFRLVLSYPSGNAAGVWLEPFPHPIKHFKAHSVSQRMVDVVRGLQNDKIVFISNTNWFYEGENRTLLTGGNVVYGIDAADSERLGQFPLDQAPFLYANWLSRSVAEDHLRVGVIAQRYEKDAEGLTGKVLREYWRKQNALYGNDLLACR